MKRAGSLTLLSLALALPAEANWERGDSAPSVYLNYNSSYGQSEYSDMLINTVRVDKSFAYSYFASIVGGLTQVGDKTRDEGGFYMGMQETNDKGEKDYIFSIWNPLLYLNKNNGGSEQLVKGTFQVNQGETITAGNELIYTAEKDMQLSIDIKNDIIKGYDEEENLLFSANEETSLTPDYTCPGLILSRFGGEGRGAISVLYETGLWDLGTSYSFVTKIWDEDNSKVGLWIYNQEKQEWLHFITFNYPSNKMKFNSGFSSFLEDFAQTTDVEYVTGKYERQFHATNGWNRGIDGTWYFKSKASVTGVESDSVKYEGRCWKFYHNYDSGVDADGFYLLTGGSNTEPTNKYGSLLTHVEENPYINLTEPVFAPLFIDNFWFAGDSISWNLLASGAPQFSCAYTVFDAFETVVLSDTLINSEKRSFLLDTKGLSGSYKIVLKLTDIFDKEYTAELTHEFGSPLQPCSELLSSVTANSWGTMIDVPVNSTSEIVELKIENQDGELADASVVFGPQEMHGPYTHSLYLPTQFLSDNVQYFLVAKVGEQECKAAFMKEWGLTEGTEQITLNHVYADGNSVNFSVTSPVSGDAYAIITSLDGVEIAKQYFYMNAGTNVYDIYAPIQSGMSYILNVYSTGAPAVERFVVK